VASAGSATVLRVVIRLYTGSIATAGALRNTAQLSLSATITTASTVVKSVSFHIAGTLSPTGAHLKAFPRLFTGAITTAGSVVLVSVADLTNHSFTTALAGARHLVAIGRSRWSVGSPRE
jgi:hypothetical protein